MKGPSSGSRQTPALIAPLFLFGAVFALLLPCHGADVLCPRSDLTGDCRVDMADLLAFVDAWLAPEEVCQEDGLVARWRMDEPGGEWAYDQTGAYPAVLVGSARFDPTGGRLDGAVVLDGDGDYLEVPGYSGIIGSAPRTCAAWVRTTEALGPILMWGNPDRAGGKWDMRINALGRLQVAVKDGYLFGSTPVTTELWTHVAVVLPQGTHNTEEVMLYVNGVPEGNVTCVPREIDTAAADDVLIGYDGDQTYFDGWIDDVRVYARALNGDEIWRLYANGTTVVGCADLDGRAGVNQSDFTLISRDWRRRLGPVLISEFMADNETDDLEPDQQVLDGDGEPSDWIELVNVSDHAVDLTGWSLVNGDAPDNLTRWSFPEGLTLAARGYLLLFASDKPAVPPYRDGKGYYHTNFKLSKDGEYLALLDDEDQVIHAYDEFEYATGRFGYPPQEENISYGVFYGQSH